MQEEEEMRIKEYEYLRDMFKKLLYSLEQVNMQTIDSKGIMKQETSIDQEKRTLPNLLGNGSKVDMKAKSVTDFNKTIEFMMMKRLHFLRNSLDSHDPVETTNRMRENAARKRDERILDLWNRDKTQPTIDDLVNNMKYEFSKIPRNDFSEHDFASANENSMIHVPQQDHLAQNSLFSSINAPNTSISNNNSIQITMGDSRLNNQKASLEEDATIGGSTQYPGAFESINNSLTKGQSPMSRPSQRGQKQNAAARIQ